MPQGPARMKPGLQNSSVGFISGISLHHAFSDISVCTCVCLRASALDLDDSRCADVKDYVFK